MGFKIAVARHGVHFVTPLLQGTHSLPGIRDWRGREHNANNKVASIWQPRSSQTFGQNCQVFRAMELQPILEARYAKRGVEPAQIVHRFPRFVHSPDERTTRGQDAEHDEKAR
jgi:hypothetical protein